MTDSTSAERRADLARKITGLLEKAAATPFGPEADAFRAKADELATAYAIEQWELDKHRPKQEREVPERRGFVVGREDNPMYDALADLLWVIANHARCKMVYHGLRSGLKHHETLASVVGFPSDLDYVEALWVSLQIQLAANVKPSADPNASEAENLAKLKEAGMKWKDIHAVLHPDVTFERRHGVRYTKMYTDYCAEHDRDRMYTSPTVYVRSYAEGFVAKISLRLAEIRDRQRAEGGVASGGAELVLRDKFKDVQDLFSDLWPKLGLAPKQSDKKTDWNANRAGVRAGERADLGQGGLKNKRELQ